MGIKMQFLNDHDKFTKEGTKEIDEYLKTSNEISEEVFNAIRSAMAVNSANEVDWAVKRIKIIYKRIHNGDRIYIPLLQKELNKETWKEIRDRYFQ